MAGGGTRRPAQEGAATRSPCLPSAEAWGPLRLWPPRSQGLRHGARREGCGEGLQALPPGTTLTWSSRSVPSSLAAGWAQEGLRGSPHAPVTGTKAGKPFWDAYPKGEEQRKKLKVLQGANHSGQSFDPEIVLLSGPNP